MGSVPEKRRLRHSYVLVLVLVLVFAAWLRSPDLVPWIVSFSGHDAQGETLALVDRFTAIGCLFSGFAFVGLVYSVILQRKDLDRSIEEMRKSADAQTAQVKLGALSALLASLPVLIQEEENRVQALAVRNGGCGLHENLAAYTADKLKQKIGEIEAKVSDLQRVRKERQKTADEAVGGSREPREREKLSQTEGEIDQYKHLLVAVGRLISLRQELAVTYEEMRKYQNWKLSDSDTSVSTDAEGSGSQY